MTEPHIYQFPAAPRRKGIILAGGSGSRLFPVTKAVNKQLLPVYDKPLIYYPLATLLLAGIRELLLITSPEQAQKFQQLLGDGSAFGVSISYAVQPRPEGLAQAFLIGREFLGDAPAALILGDNVFHGPELPNLLRQANAQVAGATVFAYPVRDPHRYGVIEFDQRGKAISIEEKPQQPRSRFAVPGLYFYDNSVIEVASTLVPSSRGELEITDVNLHYLRQNCLNVVPMPASCHWFDTGTPDALLEASAFVQSTQNQLGRLIGCPEETAFGQGLLSESEVRQAAENYPNHYGDYLRSLTRGTRRAA